jgi:hypothetical protein
MQKLIDTLPRVSANAMYDRISRPRSNNFLQFAIDDFQHRPMLNDSKPIEEWLGKSGMTAEEARQTAVGLYALLADLASTGGMIKDDSGRTRMIPIANMLDREIFETQGSDRIAIDVITQAWAIQLWIGSTIAACLAGIFAIPYLMFRRANAKL